MLDLDRIAEDLRQWGDALVESGGRGASFVWGDEPGPNLLYLNDLVWIQYVIGDASWLTEHRETLVAEVNSWQEEDGRYRYREWESHGWEHATWQSVGALSMLGARPARRLAFISQFSTPVAVYDWVATFDWETTHHRFLLVPLLASSGVPEGWLRAFFVHMQAHQDAESGFWPDARDAGRLSSTFLIALLHTVLGYGPPRRERIADTTLAFQREDGLFSPSGELGYLEMDAAYLLWSIASRTGYRLDECLGAVEHLARRMDADYLHEEMPILRRNPHAVLAACGACAVVQAFAPHCVKSSRRWRFPWAEAGLFRAS